MSTDHATAQPHRHESEGGLSARDLEIEGRAAGLTPEPALHIAETDAHLGSTVVLLRG